MNFVYKTLGIIFITLYTSTLSIFSSDNTIKPVTPKASPEVTALLKFLYSISGKYTLAGQHNYPNIKDRNTQFAFNYTGKTPVVFSTDWGFAKPGDTDSHLARPDIIEEVKRQHRLGSIITICWHAVPPTANEPVTFRPQPGYVAPDSLASVQGQLLDQQFRDVLTPGTKLYKHWCEQVDTIAFYLKKLRDVHIPVLWRPYHEMNGGWFWWGGRQGKYSTVSLYRQLYDRFVNFHKLNNLIWVWSLDMPNKPEMQFSKFYPGNEYFDVLSLDVYGNDFKQSYYDSLILQSKGKPLVLAEVGNPPSPKVLKDQPMWTYYVTWAGMVRNTLKRQYISLLNGTRILCREDTTYQNIIVPYRTECGLPSLTLKSIKPVSSKVDFSGDWIFNEEESILDNFGVSFLPYELKLKQTENELNVQKTFILEYADNRIIEEKLTLDGKECESEMLNAPRIMKARWSENSDTLIIESKVIFNMGGRTSEMILDEAWSLEEYGRILAIKQFSDSFWGVRKITLFFDKQ